MTSITSQIWSYTKCDDNTRILDGYSVLINPKSIILHHSLHHLLKKSSTDILNNALIRHQNYTVQLIKYLLDKQNSFTTAKSLSWGMLPKSIVHCCVVHGLQKVTYIISDFVFFVFSVLEISSPKNRHRVCIHRVRSNDTYIYKHQHNSYKV